MQIGFILFRTEDPPLIVARGGASVSGDHYIIVHMQISPRGRASRGAGEIKINIVKLRQGSGKDCQDMAIKRPLMALKGFKA